MAFQTVIKDKSIETLVNTEINSKENKYKYGLIFSIDGIFLDKVEKIDYKYSKNTFIEARFFDEEKELYIFYDGDDFKAVQTNKSEWDKEFVIRDYLLHSKFQPDGYKSLKKEELNSVKVIEFISLDDDGQAYVEATCLHGITGMKEGEE